MLSDVEDFLLSLIHDGRNRATLRVESVGGNFVAGRDQLAQHRTLAHDLGIPADVACTGHILGQRVQVGQTTHLFRLAHALKVLKHGDDVRRLGSVDQGANSGKHQFVFVTVKIPVRQQVAYTVPGGVVQQQAAQHAGFGLDGMWRDAQLGDLTVLAVIINGRKYGRHGR